MTLKRQALNMDTLELKSCGSVASSFTSTSIQVPVDMSRVAGVILGGGQGSRLFPLTATRCKPAVRFCGKYRLIDVPLSNCINSHIHKIFVITQFLSSSLHRHLFQTYRFDRFSSGFLEILSAEQRPSANMWFQGTADAVRQNLEYLVETPVDYFLILSGDQLYNMDFSHMVRFAKATDADLVLSVLPVGPEEARRMGILKVDHEDWITEFYEKPEKKSVLDQLECLPSVLHRTGVSPASNRCYLGSMGIYLFKREALFKLLKTDVREDFGKHLIPTKVQEGGVAAYIYDGYWEDIGTIKSFYHANLAMTQPTPAFRCYDEGNPVYCYNTNLPAPKVFQTYITNSILCEGAIVQADEVSHSILGPRSVAKRGCLIRDSYVMGNDFYQAPFRHLDRCPRELVIGEDCIIQKAIIDKNVCIGDGVKLVNKDNLSHYDGEHIYIRDGIIVVTRGAHVPNGFVL